MWLNILTIYLFEILIKTQFTLRIFILIKYDLEDISVN